MKIQAVWFAFLRPTYHPAPARRNQPLMTYKRILKTWSPLAASWMLMAAELPALSAVVARLPQPEINLYIDDHPAELILVGSRGLSGVRSWLLGSLSRKLVHNAPCSVLVVRGTPLC